jgi:hypothetical protein
MPDSGIFSAFIGAVVGALASVILQISARRWRIGQARKSLRVDLGLLIRHIDASLKSLEIPPDAPVFILASRLRYARFEDLMLTKERLELIEALKEQERARLLIVSIRNSDILLEELAARIGDIKPSERPKALEEARLNLRILRETISHLRLDEVATQPQTPSKMAESVRTRLQEKALHAEADRSN